MHGLGCLTYKDGSSWKGTFEYNRKHGPGLYTYLDGRSEKVRYFLDWSLYKWFTVISLFVLALAYFFR